MILAELAQWIEQVFFLNELQHGGALAARDNQPLHGFQIRGRSHFHHLRAGSRESALMRLEVALEGENTNPLHYQPRVCSSSDSGNLAMSRPNIAVPSSSLASSNFTGSL